MGKVAIGVGHCFRTAGATGTNGEQEFNDKVAKLILARLNLRGHTAKIFLADDPPPAGFDAVVHLHTDGSTNLDAHGASVGYPIASRYGQRAEDRGRAFGAAWKQAYQAHGWERGFRSDNNTGGLAEYYGHQKALDAGIPRSLVVEHGFMTNAKDRAWMLANGERIAQTHVDAVEAVVPMPGGSPASPAPLTGSAPGTYVVREGDTLFGIALRLHITGGWPALYEKNRQLIGPDPAKIRKGQVLKLP